MAVRRAADDWPLHLFFLAGAFPFFLSPAAALAQGEAVAAKHGPAAYVLQGTQLVEHEVPIRIYFSFWAHNRKNLNESFRVPSHQYRSVRFPSTPPFSSRYFLRSSIVAGQGFSGGGRFAPPPASRGRGTPQ